MHEKTYGHINLYLSIYISYISYISQAKTNTKKQKFAGVSQYPPLPEYFYVVHYNHWSSGNSKPRPLVLRYTVQKFFPKIELKRKTFQDFSEIFVFGKFNNIRFLDCVYASRLLPFFWIFLNSVQPEMPRKEVQQIFPTTTKYE